MGENDAAHAMHTALDAYREASTDLLEWKRRALDAEARVKELRSTLAMERVAIAQLEEECKSLREQLDDAEAANAILSDAFRAKRGK